MNEPLRLNKKSLLAKGLIRVGTLLVVELAFIGTLFFLMNQIEVEGLREEHSKKVVGTTNEIFQLIYDTGRAADKFIKHQRPEDETLYHTGLIALKQHIDELKPLVASDARQTETVRQIDQTAEHGFGVLDTLLMDIKEKGVDAAKSDLERALDLAQMREVLQNDLRELMEEQNKTIQDSFAKRIQYVRAVKPVLVGGLIINVVGALVMAIFFWRDIIGRLEVIMENIRLLAANKPLQTPLPEDDQIAYLDQTFHNMANALHEAAERKKEIVAMVSHDLRTPLTSIQGFLNILQRGGYGETNPKIEQRAQMAENNATRLIKLINDLLDLEKLEAGKMDIEVRNVDCAKLIERSLNSVNDFAEKHGVTLVVEDANATVLADEERTVQVLVNLLSNAIKFSGKDTMVKIQVSEKDGNVLFRIVDQGPGIPPAAQAQLFERFKQVDPKEDRKRGGTGLGLAICKAIVEQSNGDLGVESELGKGSCFWFTLPKIETVDEPPHVIKIPSKENA